jgi:hypothetical protein
VAPRRTPSCSVGSFVLLLAVASCGDGQPVPRERPSSSSGLAGLGGPAGTGGELRLDAAASGAGGTAADASADLRADLGGDLLPRDSAADVALGVDVAVAGPDLAADLAVDAAIDAAVDAAVDAASDVAADLAVDVPADARADVAADLGVDLGRDAMPDLSPDVAPDVGADAAGGAGGLPAFCGSYPPAPGGWQSAHVTYAGGRLSYPADAEQNRVPDFSYAGYRYGESSLPVVPHAMRLDPAPGDNTQRIQAALDAVGALPLNGQGLRGALLLGPGLYEVAGTLRINKAGVVLRGSGDGADPATATIIVATGDIPHQRPVIVAGSGSRTWNEGNPRSNISTPFVQVSAMKFDVESAAGFAVGDAVVIRHPSTQAWIDALGGGGVVTMPKWTPGTRDIVYHRFIRAISGNTLTVDAPIFNHLDRSLSQAYVAKAASMPYLARVGVEDLRVDIQTLGGEDENHAWTAVSFTGAIDSWARKVTALHFGWAGLEADGALRITMDDSTAIEPVAIRTGGRMYNFAMEGLAQLVLVRRCHAADGRHSLVGSGASTTSGNVFYRCTLTRGGASEGGHRQWTQGMLYDNIVESVSSSISLINRGDFGTSHGWGCVHSVVWSYNSTMTAQKPPTGQNYAISPAGKIDTTPPFPGPPGVYELKGAGLSPASLYEAQLCDRLEN